MSSNNQLSATAFLNYVVGILVSYSDLLGDNTATRNMVGGSLAGLLGVTDALPSSGGITPLAISAPGGSLNITVGGANQCVFVGGRWSDNCLPQVVPVNAGSASNPRVDLIAIQYNQLANQNGFPRNVESAGGVVTPQTVYYEAESFNLVYVAGTPSPTPSAPATPSGYVAFANIAVAQNATQIVNGNITYVLKTFSQALGVTPVQVVTTLNGVYGAANLLSGTGISVTVSGQNITITNTTATAINSQPVQDDYFIMSQAAGAYQLYNPGFLPLQGLVLIEVVDTNTIYATTAPGGEQSSQFVTAGVSQQASLAVVGNVADVSGFLFADQGTPLGIGCPNGVSFAYTDPRTIFPLIIMVPNMTSGHFYRVRVRVFNTGGVNPLFVNLAPFVQQPLTSGYQVMNSVKQNGPFTTAVVNLVLPGTSADTYYISYIDQITGNGVLSSAMTGALITSGAVVKQFSQQKGLGFVTNYTDTQQTSGAAGTMLTPYMQQSAAPAICVGGQTITLTRQTAESSDIGYGETFVAVAIHA